MKWSEVRATHPESWSVIEALRSHHEGTHFVVDDLAVVATCEDGAEAFAAYRDLHKQHPDREFLFIHTSQEEHWFEERRRIGFRISA